MLQLEARHWETIHNILRKYPYSFYAYGSRVKGEARRLSDLDICYQEDVPLSTVSLIKEEFEESNLPFEVEVVAWKNMRPAFQAMIKPDLILISFPRQAKHSGS